MKGLLPTYYKQKEIDRRRNDMKLEDLSPELQEKIESCETVEELTNLVMSDANIAA